jgi:methionine-rich copper-binding protein CopC
MSSRSSRLSVIMLAALLPAALVLGTATPASAHDELIGSTPAAGASVAELSSVTLDYSAQLLGEGANVVQVVGPDGLFYDSGCTTVEGTTAGIETALGQAGQYEIRWQVVSSDGHPISGTVPFTYAPGEDGTEYVGSATARACGDEYRTEAAVGEVAASPSASASDEAAPSPSEEAGEAQPTESAANAFPVLPVVIGGIVLLAIAVAVVLLLTRRRGAGRS